MKTHPQKGPKSAKMNKKEVVDLVRFLEFKGKEYQYKKKHMFHSEEAKANGRRFRAECDRRLANIFRGLGVSCWDDIIQQTEDNVRQSKTCKLCNFYCANYYTLESHVNSENCKKRQAEQRGEDFVHKRESRKQCKICDKSILFYNWPRHLEGVYHLENVRKLAEPAFQCTVCDKVFKGGRPKVMLKKHLITKKHLKKIEEPGNRWKHDALIKKHFSKVRVV